MSMATVDRVIQLHEKYPHLTAPQIAARLGCAPAYVRACAQRMKLELPHARPGLFEKSRKEGDHGV